MRVLPGVVMVLLVSLLGCDAEPPPAEEPARPVRAIKVGDIERHDRNFLPGRARAFNEVDLSFRVAGPLIGRPVNVGDQVLRGDLVARIDPQDYQVELANAEGQLDNAKATLTRTQADLERQLRIMERDPGATSQASIDQAREGCDQVV